MGNRLSRKGKPTSIDEDDVTPTAQKYIAQLSEFIEVQYGLPDELRSKGWLSVEQFENIRSIRTMTSAARLLLNLLSDRSHQEQEIFLEALNATHQKHVVNFIRRGGQRASDDWSLWADEQIKSKINNSWRMLVEIIDTRTGLLDELVIKKCISWRQKRSIDNGVKDGERNEELLAILQRRSAMDYRECIRCLVVTEQHLAGSLLELDDSTNDRICPVNERTTGGKPYPTE